MPIKVIHKKRGRPATGKDPLIALRLPPELIKAVDAWAERCKVPSRSAAVRTMVETAIKESPDEWGQLVAKMGTLALTVGVLEMAIISMVCRILGQAEEEVGIRKNSQWCEKFIEVVPTSWSTEERIDLAKRLKKIRRLYGRRNRLIHAALALASDGSIAGVPAGSVIDLRTYGVGFTSRKGNTWTIGIVGKRLHLHEIDRLTADVHRARLGLVPYMELVDTIKHPAKPFPMPKLGKRIS